MCMGGKQNPISSGDGASGMVRQQLRRRHTTAGGDGVDGIVWKCYDEAHRRTVVVLPVVRQHL